jgi:hypothetical protein
MAEVISLKTQVQTLLVNAALGFNFPKVTYNSDGTPLPIDDEAYETPQTPILCNEVGGSFVIDNRHGRDRILKHESWAFELRMKFGGEVLLETFEDEMRLSPPYFGESQKRVALLMARKEVTHPVQQQSATGTQVTYIFQAQVGRE